MAEWKKVLVSGSDISVAAITASNVPDGAGTDKVLVVTSDGGIKKVDAGVIQGVTQADFTLSADAGSNVTFDATADTLIFGGHNGVSTTVSDSGNDSTIKVILPNGTVSASNQISIEDTIGYDSFSSSFADVITTNETNIATNTADITLLQDDIIELVASSSELTQASASIATFITNTNTTVAGALLDIVALESFSSSAVTNDATGSFIISESVIGTTGQITVTGNTPQGLQIGLPDDVTISGKLEAQRIKLTAQNQVEAAAAVVSGSTLQGNSLTDTHRFTGSLEISGALDVKGTSFAISNISELSGTQDIDAVLVRRYSDGRIFRAGNDLKLQISGAFDEVSASLAATVAGFSTDTTTTNSTDIAALEAISSSLLISASEGIRFETSVNNGGSSGLGQTASFEASGEGLSVDILNDGVDTTTVTYTINPSLVGAAMGAFTGSEQLEAALDGIYVNFNEAPISGAEQLQALGFITSSDFDNLTGVPNGLISESLNGAEGTQGQIILNGVAKTVSGLGTSDSPTFANVTVSNLTVNGTTTALNTDNVLIEDQFLLINSGAGATENDKMGGIVVDSGTGVGTALIYDYAKSSWGFIGASNPETDGVDHTATGPVNGGVGYDVQIASVAHAATGDGVEPTAAPSYGAGDYQKGQMHINTSDNTIWIYV